jgi:MEDS: MEthanogen/methylotroph, DcmR Sensory domain
MCPSFSVWPGCVFAASAQAHYLLAGTRARRQRERAGVGWSSSSKPGCAAAIRGIESGQRRAGPPGQNAAICVKVRNLDTARHPTNLTGNTFGPHGHICAFFNSVDEQHRVLRPFIKGGFDQGDKAYHYVDPELRDAHLGWLAEAGIDVQRVMASGQLEVWPWQDSTLRGERFELSSWLASFEQVLQSGPAAGYAQTRFMGHMEWALLDLPGVGDLIEYETLVNYVISKYEGSVICTYDLTKFGASVVMDALRTHPAVIIGGLLQENPFFVPPDELLQEIRERRPASVSASAAE